MVERAYNALSLDRVNNLEELICIINRRTFPAPWEFTRCWYWDGITEHPNPKYRPVMTFRVNGQHKSGIKVARVVLLITEGKIESNKHACHICHNQLCVRPLHIYAGSPKENYEQGNSLLNNWEYGLLKR